MSTPRPEGEIGTVRAHTGSRVGNCRSRGSHTAGTTRLGHGLRPHVRDRRSCPATARRCPADVLTGRDRRLGAAFADRTGSPVEGSVTERDACRLTDGCRAAPRVCAGGGRFRHRGADRLRRSRRRSDRGRRGGDRRCDRGRRFRHRRCSRRLRRGCRRRDGRLDDRRRWRGGRRRRRRNGHGRRGGRWRRRGRLRGSRREQADGIDVSVLSVGGADPQVDGRNAVLGLSARAHRADRPAFVDHVALHHLDRREVEERHGVAVRRQDRDAATVSRHGARERHRAGRRSANRAAGRAGDVDAAMLPGGVRVGAQLERAEHLAVRGPRPGCGAAAQGKCHGERCAEHEESVHKTPPSFSARATREWKGIGAVGRRQSRGVNDER